MSLIIINNTMYIEYIHMLTIQQHYKTFHKISQIVTI